MKAIKALVVFMGVLLVVGLGLVGYGVATKTGAPPPTTKSRAVAATVGGEFGSVNVSLPAGARLEQTLVAGEKLVLRVTGGGPDRLIVLDPADGRVTGSFVLSPETPVGR